MKARKQDTRPGTQRLEEKDTYDLLEKLTPSKWKRCRGKTKAVGRACVEAWTPQAIIRDDRVDFTLSCAAYYLRTLPGRLAEVKQAADEVVLAACTTEEGAK